jgi:ABC-type lipoprotein release transport system permease subunit
MMLAKIAWRNLWRNRRRTQLTMGAMLFACAMLVFSLGYYDGMLWNMINSATNRENGHICLARKGYLDVPGISETLTEKEAFAAVANSEISYQGLCPRLNTFALISCGTASENRTQPAQIMGVDFAAELNSSQLAADMFAGKFLQGNQGEILLGQALAQKIKASVGAEIVFFSNATDGSLASALFKVKGIFSSGDAIRDSSLAIVNIKELQSLMALEEQIHSLRIFLPNPMQAEETAARLDGRYDHIEARAWKTMFPQLADLLNMWLTVQIFTSAIYYAALALITFNTMYMAFLERKHEFAVMQAIGLTRKRLATLILLESLMLSLLSGVLGAITGTAINVALYYYPIDLTRWIDDIAWGGTQLKAEIFCVPSPLSTGLPLVAMILLGILVALLPTIRLFRLKPVEALREA